MNGAVSPQLAGRAAAPARSRFHDSEVGRGASVQTRSRRSLGAALIGAGCACALLACADGEPKHLAAHESMLDAGPPRVHARFVLSKAPMRFGDVPWPDDAYLDDSGHVSVRDIPSAAPAEYARALDDAMQDLDGFGIRPTVYFRFDGELDADSVPSSPEATLKPDASVFLIDADTSSPEAFVRVPVEVHYDADAMELRLRPAGARALVPGRRYAAVVTRAVKDTRGRPISASSAFARVRDADASALDPFERAARAAYAPVLGSLAPSGVAREHVAALAVFHVQTARADLAAARAIVRGEQDTPRAPVLTRALHGADLDALLGTPAAGAVGLDHGAPHDHVGWMVQGSFASPNLLSPHAAVHGAFLRNAAGDLRVRRTGDVYFTLWVPIGALPGEPMPVVVVQHGLGGERSDASAVANALAATGYAVIALDAPFHGLRASASARDDASRFTDRAEPDGFGDAPGDFAGAHDDAGELTALHPFYYRDAVRQGVIDLMSLLDLLERGDWSGLADLDPALDDVKPSGDSVAFVGFDLGAEMGAMLATYEPSVAALVLAFAGGLTLDGWIDSPRTPGLTDALFARLGHTSDTIDFAADHPLEWPDVDAWRTLADRASALAYAPALQRLPCSIFMPMARDDESVHNRSTEALASALGAEIIGGDPNYVLDLRVHGLRPGETRSGNLPVDDGAVTRVLYVLDPATHAALVLAHDAQKYQLPLARPFVPRKREIAVDNPIDATLMQVAFFLASYRACHTETPTATCAASVQAPPPAQ
jgi:dienelactone hydrolase